MKRLNYFTLATCILGCVVACGCQSLGTIARGQSPEGEVVPAGHSTSPVRDTANYLKDHPPVRTTVEAAHDYVGAHDPLFPHHAPLQAAASGVADAYQEHHNTTTTYYHQGSSACPAGAGCPPGYGGAACPNGVPNGYCPSAACPSGLCPSGQCPSGLCQHQGPYGNPLDWYPRHGFSYSYERPNDLSYPAADSVGGSVVYPYYTHKGPSDFFMK